MFTTFVDEKNGGTVKAWKDGVEFDEKTTHQLLQTASLPFVYKWVAAMPDAHFGSGSTVGTVLPTLGAVVPAAVGVDIGCGMCAYRLPFKRQQFVGKEQTIYDLINKRVPSGRTNNGGPGDRGAWHNIPQHIQDVWDRSFAEGYAAIQRDDNGAIARNSVNQLGTLGTGNHFIELAQEIAFEGFDNGQVWIVLHSGSRGLGNKIGSYFTNVAKELCEKWFVKVPNPELAYLVQDTREFQAYRRAVEFAQNYAFVNRSIMMRAVQDAVYEVLSQDAPPDIFDPIYNEINCHHNYIAWERHFGQNVMITRKGAVRADKGDLGIIPGSMGAATYIVKGLGNQDSFRSCSHGAGRRMSRTAAVREIGILEHAHSTDGVYCDKSEGTLDESPRAYKDIDAVMAAQTDLVEPIYKLKQFINVKGISDNRRR